MSAVTWKPSDNSACKWSVDTNLNNHDKVNHKVTDGDDFFWKNGLSFTCTGCGGCCQNEGDTWFTMHEFCRLVSSLGLPVEDILDIYVHDIVADWVKMKHKVCVDTGVDQCIFLDASGGNKRCSIYEDRPIHCKTYPFWPTIVSTVTSWENEGKVFGNYYKSADVGYSDEDSLGRIDGCEGINHADSVLIPSIILQRSIELYKAYTDDHPSNVQYSSYKSAITERQRLINLLNEMEVKRVICTFLISSFLIIIISAYLCLYQVVINSTKQWLQQRFDDEGYAPSFDGIALPVEDIRYIVYLESYNKEKVIRYLKMEVDATSD